MFLVHAFKHTPFERSQQALQHRHGFAGFSNGAQSACKDWMPSSSQTSLGISPVNSFRCNHANISFGRPPNWLGIGPVNRLLLTLNNCSCWSSTSSVVGRDPVKVLRSSTIACKFVKLQSSTGIVPASRLSFSWNIFSLVSFPNWVGIVPYVVMKKRIKMIAERNDVGYCQSKTAEYWIRILYLL